MEIEVLDADDRSPAMTSPTAGVVPHTPSGGHRNHSPDIGSEPTLVASGQYRCCSAIGTGYNPWSLPLSHPGTHNYLALSFQRLQQLHLAAVQERMKYGPLSPYPLPMSPPHGPLSPPSRPMPLPPRDLPARHPETFPYPVSRLLRPDVLRQASQKYEDLEKRPWPMFSPLKLDPRSPPAASPVMSPAKTTWSPATVLGDLASPPATKRRDEPTRYHCEACNKSYATFSGLSKHKQFHCASHVKKEFSCKFCDKTYVSLGALKMHIRTHTLPCKCPLCGKAFSRPWLLQGHIRTHTGEKPFKCQHCARAFADRSNLRAHLQTHSDVKKYSCKTCTKTFSRMSLLLKHRDNGCSGLMR